MPTPLTDRVVEGERKPSDSVAHGPTRPMEPHWEAVIDSATD
jgi:hypothetical protein